MSDGVLKLGESSRNNTQADKRMDVSTCFALNAYHIDNPVRNLAYAHLRLWSKRDAEVLLACLTSLTTLLSRSFVAAAAFELHLPGAQGPSLES